MLLSLVIFVIGAGTLLLIFSSPKCDSMANTTAYNLKVAIDEVSKDSFSTWSKSSVPTDSDIDYYRTVPIRLCQDKGVSWLENILGTTLEPQYKIYYERFPEGGGGTWTEAYPWGGGAAASLRMWAAMRIGYGVFKLSAKYLTKLSIFTTYTEKLYGLGEKIKDDISSTAIDDIDEMAKLVPEVGAVPDSKPADWLIQHVKVDEAWDSVKDTAQDGTIASIGGDPAIEKGTNKLVISSAMQSPLIPVQYYDNGVSKTFYAEVYVLRDSSGEIVDMTTDASKGWPMLYVSPEDLYRDWLDTLTPNARKTYESIYVTQDEAGPLISLKGNLRQTGFYKTFYEPMEDKLKELVVSFDTAGYRVEITELTTQEINGLKLGTIKALEDGDVSAMLLNQPDLKDKIAKALGKSAESIHAGDVKDFINSFKLNGILFQVKGQDLEVLPLAVKKILDASSNNLVLTSDGLKQAIFDDPAGKQIMADMQKLLGMSDIQEAKDRVGQIVENIFPAYYTPGDPISKTLIIGSNKVGLYSGFTDEYLRSLASDYYYSLGNPKIEQEAETQLASFLGFVEQNKGELPASVITRKGMVSDILKSQAKKMIYLDGPQNILNPDSFYARALFSDLATAGCQGNSICLYSYGAAAESPIYLNETAKNYFVRVWRPVSILEQIAGWQAALQHVPEHPRFYVVSPCMATAKIWKTTYNNQPTIFVYPEKIGLEGNASNYCYADEDLIKTYTFIWLVSDVATVIQTVDGFAISKAVKDATYGITNYEAVQVITDSIKNSYNAIANKVFSIADPITLAQGMVEGAVSWPGFPFKTLTSDIIAAYSNKFGIKEIKKV